MLDPEIGEFVRAVTEIYSHYPARDQLTVQRARVVGAEARGRWAAGGPVMVRTDDISVPAGTGFIRLRIYRPKDMPSPGPALGK